MKKHHSPAAVPDDFKIFLIVPDDFKIFLILLFIIVIIFLVFTAGKSLAHERNCGESFEEYYDWWIEQPCSMRDCESNTSLYYYQHYCPDKGGE